MADCRWVLLLCIVVAMLKGSKQENCPEGWEKAFGSESWKCVSTLEDDSGKDCIQKGGVPGVILSITNDKNGSSESYARKCVKDLRKGDFDMVRNMKKILEEIRAEEEALKKKEEHQMDTEEE